MSDIIPVFEPKENIFSTFLNAVSKYVIETARY
jgi:hypothetical protein